MGREKITETMAERAEKHNATGVPFDRTPLTQEEFKELKRQAECMGSFSARDVLKLIATIEQGVKE